MSELKEDIIRAAIHKTKKKKSFDMFADDDDFNHGNMGVAEFNVRQGNNEAENPHLIDNWDDAEGYYSKKYLFQSNTSFFRLLKPILFCRDKCGRKS